MLLEKGMKIMKLIKCSKLTGICFLFVLILTYVVIYFKSNNATKSDIKKGKEKLKTLSKSSDTIDDNDYLLMMLENEKNYNFKKEKLKEQGFIPSSGNKKPLYEDGIVLNTHDKMMGKPLTTMPPSFLASSKNAHQSKGFKKLMKGEANMHYYNEVKADADNLNLTFVEFWKSIDKSGIKQDAREYIANKIAVDTGKPILAGSILNMSETMDMKNVYSDPQINVSKPIYVTSLNDIWQIQKDSVEIYLYTAFYDDRPALAKHQVRVIAVTETAISETLCLLWYWNQSYPDISRVEKQEIGPKISPNAKKQYVSYLFSCNVNSNKTKPEYVSIITIQSTVPTNLIKIHIPEKYAPKDQIEFGHCMSVLYWDHNPYRIVEWMELHRMWGVGEFNIYVNNLSDKIRSILEFYTSEGIMNVRELPNVIADSSEWTILMNMSPAINDCMYRNMYRYKKIICTDTDEMIVPIIHKNYSSLAKAIENQPNVTDHPHASYIFRNVYFFNDFGPVYKRPVILHTQRYLKHITPSVFGYSAKSITDPQTCIALQNHLCWKRVPKYDHPGWLIDVNTAYGMNFHYKQCHFDEYLEQEGECVRMMANYSFDYTMRQFRRELFPRTKNILRDLGII